MIQFQFSSNIHTLCVFLCILIHQLIKMTTLNILFKTTSLCLAMALLVGCNDNDDNDSSTPAPRSNQTVNILAFNDFHGNLEPPKRYVEAANQMMHLKLYVFLSVV